MTIYNRPDATVPVWAESGDKVQPTDPEIQTGWPLSNTPPSRQRFNWILGEVAEAVRYLLQRGIAEWSADEDYPINARVQYAGDVYTSLVTNINVVPGTNPAIWSLGASSKTETAPQFDADNSVASTAFVQRALGSRSTNQVYSAAQALTAADVGKQLIASALAANVAWTLPASAGVPIGSAIHIKHASSGGFVLTVQRSGADSIFTGGTPINSFTMLVGDSVTLINSTGGWLIADGSSVLRYATGAFGASLAATGYQRLPSGLILQWFDQAVTNVPTDYSFPLAFPTAGLKVFIVDGEASAASITFAGNITSATQYRAVCSAASVLACVFAIGY